MVPSVLISLMAPAAPVHESSIWEPAVGITFHFLKREVILKQDCVSSGDEGIAQLSSPSPHCTSDLDENIHIPIHLSDLMLMVVMIWVLSQNMWYLFHYISTIPVPLLPRDYFPPQSSLVLIL